MANDPDRCAALLRHDGMEATTNNVGEAHEDSAVEQALRVRGSGDFAKRGCAAARIEM